MVLLFKGIAPLSQSPATIASGAPPKPNHAVFKAELMYVSKPFGGAGGGGRGGVSPRALCLFQKKFSPRTTRPQRVHLHQWYIVCRNTLRMLSLKAPMSHLRTHASCSSGTRRPCGMGALGWATSKWAASLYNQTVVAHWGPFTDPLVQGLALVAVDIRLQEIAHGCDGHILTATTVRLQIDLDCNGKRIVQSSRDPQKPQILARDRAACPCAVQRACTTLDAARSRGKCGRDLTLFGPLSVATLSSVGTLGIQG